MFILYSLFFLVALANGGILELPWMLVDPRRPTNPDMREEGVIPYMPEIPIHTDAIINYNQSISRVMGIRTSPSGLESTCLVFVYGLGEYYISPDLMSNYASTSDDHHSQYVKTNDCCRSVLYESGTI